MTDSKVKVVYGELDDFEYPKILYKYRYWDNKYHKRFILNREVYLASPGTFEDELDCHNPTRFDLLTKDQIYQYFIWHSKKENTHFTRQQHRHFAREWAKISAINDKEHVKKYMAKSIQDYYDREGILSLTQKWDNQRMWDKYAANEKGFCIGYNTLVLFNHLGGGGPVSYVDELPNIFPEPFMEFGEAMRNRVYYKLKKWEFEEEYRTKNFWPYKVQTEERRIELPREAFNKIIVGNNMSKECEEELRRIVLENIGPIEIIKRMNV